MARIPSGYKMKFLELPFIEQLKDLGYTYKNLPSILGTSRDNYIKLFQEPTRFTLKQLMILSYLLSKPLPEIMNTLFKTPVQSPHYLKEDYSTNYHVQKIKADLIAKNILPNPTI